jgi:flagellar hook-length control protein FliK
MRISEQALNVPVSTNTATSAGASTSDRFLRLLEKSEKEREEHSEDHLGNQDAPGTGAFGPVTQAQFSVVPGASAVDSSSAASPSSQIEKLVAEMVQKIHSFQGADGTRHLDIQFNSKTLEGLHVRIERRDGALNIQFSTKSDAVASLLSHNVGDLRAALELHGMKVSNIALSKPANTLVSRYAQPKRGPR